MKTHLTGTAFAISASILCSTARADLRETIAPQCRNFSDTDSDCRVKGKKNWQKANDMGGVLPGTYAVTLPPGDAPQTSADWGKEVLNGKYDGVAISKLFSYFEPKIDTMQSCIHKDKTKTFQSILTSQSPDGSPAFLRTGGRSVFTIKTAADFSAKVSTSLRASLKAKASANLLPGLNDAGLEAIVKAATEIAREAQSKELVIGYVRTIEVVNAVDLAPHFTTNMNPWCSDKTVPPWSLIDGVTYAVVGRFDQISSSSGTTSLSSETQAALTGLNLPPNIYATVSGEIAATFVSAIKKSESKLAQFNLLDGAVVFLSYHESDYYIKEAQR